MTSTDTPKTSQPVLDNAVWHSIDGAHRELAERLGRAGRYHRDVAPMAAVGDADGWNDLSRLIGPGHRAMLFAPNIEVPAGWTAEHTFPCVQMVAGDVPEPRADIELVDLGPQDVPEILDLIAATRPGPFEKRTIELGRYLGHRVDGRLVAMAGERMRVPGFTEVSAVCTAADHRGRGIGAALTLAVVDHIRSRGDEAFLHASADNTNAIRLYIALGFELRTEPDVVIARPNDGG